MKQTKYFLFYSPSGSDCTIGNLLYSYTQELDAREFMINLNWDGIIPTMIFILF